LNSSRRVRACEEDWGGGRLRYVPWGQESEGFKEVKEGKSNVAPGSKI